MPGQARTCSNWRRPAGKRISGSLIPPPNRETVARNYIDIELNERKDIYLHPASRTLAARVQRGEKTNLILARESEFELTDSARMIMREISFAQ